MNSNAVTVLEIEGRFDSHEVKSFTGWMEAHTQEVSSKIVLNLQQVVFMDSSALAALVQVMKRCRQNNGDLHLCLLQNPVRVIFELTRLDKAFQVFPGESEAIEAFK
jgi:anti-sigma B factor antagonist